MRGNGTQGTEGTVLVTNGTGKTGRATGVWPASQAAA